FERFSDTRIRHAARFCVRNALFVVLTSLGIFVASLGLLGSGVVKFVFFPSIEGNFAQSVLELPEGTASDQTLARARMIAARAETAAERLGERLGIPPD
ncbi:MAG: hypothetical protein AAFR60_09710, partial [Pseudomonadota bacterium]